MRRAWGDSPGPGGFFRKSPTSLPAQKESPAPCQSTTRVRSSLAASLKTSASVTYMLEVIAFFFFGRFNSTRRMPSERSVMISFIAFTPVPAYEFTAGPRCRAFARRHRLFGYDAANETRYVARGPMPSPRRQISCLGRAFALKAQGMAHFFLLGPQITKRVRIRRSFAAELDDQLDAVLRQCTGFARIVREQTNPLDAEIAQDRSRQVEVPAIGLKPEGMVGLNRIKAGILQLVGLQLRHQADAAALLILIDHEPATLFSDGLHGHFQLVVAITAQRPEHLSGEALRMD